MVSVLRMKIWTGTSWVTDGVRISYSLACREWVSSERILRIYLGGPWMTM